MFRRPRSEQGILMAVRIRLSRIGRAHRPYYRIVAIDGRCHREGVANEVLGSYDPLKAEKNIEIKADRLEAWVKQGALISESLSNLLSFHGHTVPAAGGKAWAKEGKPPAKKDGKVFVKATRRQVRKHAAKVKADAKAKAAAEAAAKAAAAPAAEAAEAPKA
jgi:small subunit ribosomal protein S16